MAAALPPSLSSPRSVPGGDQNTFSHFQQLNLSHAHNRGPRLTHRDYDEWTIFIFFMSLLSATNLKAEDKCGHPSSIKTTKSPPVLFESYVHCLALARAGDTQFTISRENKF